MPRGGEGPHGGRSVGNGGISRGPGRRDPPSVWTRRHQGGEQLRFGIDLIPFDHDYFDTVHIAKELTLIAEWRACRFDLRGKDLRRLSVPSISFSESRRRWISTTLDYEEDGSLTRRPVVIPAELFLRGTEPAQPGGEAETHHHEAEERYSQAIRPRVHNAVVPEKQKIEQQVEGCPKPEQGLPS